MDSDVPKELICLKCGAMLQDPHRLPCGHVLCYPNCLTRNSDGDKSKCSLCYLICQDSDVKPATELCEATMKIFSQNLARSKTKPPAEMNSRLVPTPIPRQNVADSPAKSTNPFVEWDSEVPKTGGQYSHMAPLPQATPRKSGISNPLPQKYEPPVHDYSKRVEDLSGRRTVMDFSFPKPALFEQNREDVYSSERPTLQNRARQANIPPQENWNVGRPQRPLRAGPQVIYSQEDEETHSIMQPQNRARQANIPPQENWNVGRPQRPTRVSRQVIYPQEDEETHSIMQPQNRDPQACIPPQENWNVGRPQRPSSVSRQEFEDREKATDQVILEFVKRNKALSDRLPALRATLRDLQQSPQSSTNRALENELDAVVGRIQTALLAKFRGVLDRLNAIVAVDLRYLQGQARKADIPRDFLKDLTKIRTSLNQRPGYHLMDDLMTKKKEIEKMKQAREEATCKYKFGYTISKEGIQKLRDALKNDFVINNDRRDVPFPLQSAVTSQPVPRANYSNATIPQPSGGNDIEGLFY